MAKSGRHKLPSTENLPEYQEEEKTIEDKLVPDNGLPAIQDVNKATARPKAAWGHMESKMNSSYSRPQNVAYRSDIHGKGPSAMNRIGGKIKSRLSKLTGKGKKPGKEPIQPATQTEPKRSPTLESKLDKALLCCSSVTFGENTSHTLDEMVRMASSTSRFDSKKQFAQYLTEGTILNVNKLVSMSIGIPCGEYVVYRITPEKSVLIPTSDMRAEETDFAGKPQGYEIASNRLLGCWNKIDNTLTEDDTPENFEKDRPDSAKMQDGGRIHPLRSKVKQAVSHSGETGEEIAAKLGVDPSTVSRWQTQMQAGGKRGDPCGRNPNTSDAIAFAQEVGGTVESLFGDAQEPQKRKATGGSGGGRHAARRSGNS